jgi:outer membrane protein assembly factor BamB
LLSRVLLGLMALTIFLSPAKATPAPTQASVVASSGAWTVYHRDDGHTGSDPTLPSVSSVSTGWTSAALDGQIYAEPLIFNGLVYSATLNNTVYAIDQATGLTVWSNHLGTPQGSGWVCGNVSPMGILGTPVIDSAASRIYAVAEIAGTTPTYHLFGLDLATGATVLNTLIAPAGFDWKIQQERGALALANGYVYVPFGGRAGDCFDGSTPYYGWVVAVPTDGVSSSQVFQTPSGAESVWAAGGVVVDDTSHNVFFATGNAIPCAGSTMSDAIVRVSPTLTTPTFFEPNDWQANWCGPDSDLGSASPVLISPTLMFTAGKRGGGFLLDPTNLGGVDGQLYPTPKPATYSQAEACFGNHAGATFGSFAYAAPYVYVECEGHGLVALNTNPITKSFSPCGATCAAPDWHAGGTTTFGPPIVAGGLVWAANNGGGLSAFNATTGAQIYQSAGFGINRFVTPAEAGGQVFVPSLNAIRSFNLAFLPWTSLGGGLIGGPDAGAGSATSEDVFVRGTDNQMWSIHWNGTSFGNFVPHGGVLTSDPGAVAQSATKTDAFVRGSDNQLWTMESNSGSFGNWIPLGGGLTSGPDADAWPTHVDVFVRGTDNQLWHKWGDNGIWYFWEPLGGVLASDPGTVSWGPNRADVFVRGTDNQLWHKWYDGIAWRPWEPLGGILSTGPDPASCSSGHLDVFAIGIDGQLWRKGYNGATWLPWQPLGGQWTAEPGAVCRPGTNLIDLSERGTDGALWYATATGS